MKPFRIGHSGKIVFPIRKTFGWFTLVELIVIITILAILATVGFLSLSGYSDDARTATVKANVRTVYSAILTESTTSGNSPRYFIDHSTGAALSGAVVFVDGNAVALSGGQFGDPGTNYSAGNPRWDRLRMNGDKFRLSSGAAGAGLPYVLGRFGTLGNEALAAYSTGELAVGAVDVFKTGANGRKRATPFFQVAGVVPGSKVAVVAGNLSAGNADGLIKDPLATGAQWSLSDGFQAASGASPESCKAVKSSVPNASDGAYWIDPDGAGPLGALRTYCDMTTEGGGWTVIAVSFANAVSDMSLPFNVDWNTLKTSGVGNPAMPATNYHISMDQYLAMANVSKPVEYQWWAKSGLPTDPWQKTLQYSDHYLSNDGFFTWNGNAVYAVSAQVSYSWAKLSTFDNDNDSSTSSCSSAYGSFGWYTKCHNAHFWSRTDELSTRCNPTGWLSSTSYDRGGTAVCNGYSNRGPDASGAYNTWYQLKIMIR